MPYPNATLIAVFVIAAKIYSTTASLICRFEMAQLILHACVRLVLVCIRDAMI